MSSNLHWSKQISIITNKANAKLSFLRRNLKVCPENLKELAYFSLVRSFMEYSATVWDPYQKFNVDKIEMVQRRAARFVKGKYRRTESVTLLLDSLGWPSLARRRSDARLILFYKVINNLAAVPYEHLLEDAYKGTRRNHSHKFRQIRYQTSQYGQSFFPKTISAWNQLEIADLPSIDMFKAELKR